MHDPTAFERFLIGLSTRLANLAAPDVGRAIDGVLRDIGEAIGADRATLLEFCDDGSAGPPSSVKVVATHAWARPGFEPAAIGAPLAAELPWYHAALVRGEVVALAHVAGDLPSDATKDREYAGAAGLKSHLSVPIALGGRLICALSTSTFRHYCSWSDRLIDRFRLVGHIAGQALLRARSDVEAPGGLSARAVAGARMRRLDEVERDYILQVIDRCHGKINGRGHAAETLGLHPNTLRSRMKKLGITRRGPPQPRRPGRIDPRQKGSGRPADRAPR